ncbi:MAG: ROK family protein [Patescibacteria group bacterium]|nr:ROK family protein [Patescibacteria group bacterium]
MGGTKIRTGLLGTRGRVFHAQKFSLNQRNKRSVLNSIIKSIKSTFIKHEVASIGIGITGLVDHRKGVVEASPNLPRSWKKVPLKKIVERLFRVPVRVDNDAHCFALGAAHTGSGKKYPVVMALTLGTGIGAGLVINGRLYRGKCDVTEFGHTMVADRSPRCSCGHVGHLEALVSGQAMSALYRQFTGRRLNTFAIEALAKRGPSAARRTIATMSHYLAIGLANAIHAYNPDLLVIGGGLSRISLLTRPAIKKARTLLVYPRLKQTKIIVVKNLAEANVAGAALICSHT